MNNFKEESKSISNNTKTVAKGKLKNWYAIYTNPRAEKKVYERLVEEGVEVFLPLETKFRVWSDRKKKIKVPYIKSYVFVRIDERDIYRKVLRVYGAVRVLKHLGKPAIVRDYEINNLRILVDNKASVTLLSSKINIEVGEEIEIDNGPLMGLKGKCVKVKGKKSIMLEFETLGDIRIVEVSAKYLKC